MLENHVSGGRGKQNLTVARLISFFHIRLPLVPKNKSEDTRKRTPESCSPYFLRKKVGNPGKKHKFRIIFSAHAYFLNDNVGRKYFLSLLPPPLPYAINVSMSNSDSGNRRSEYLKNGCRECKRRKIKCDEFINPPPEAYLKINHQGRELCWHCTRLRKTCEYPMKGERVARLSKRALLEKSKENSSLSAEEWKPSPEISSSKPKKPKKPVHLDANLSMAPPQHSEILSSASPNHVNHVVHHRSYSVHDTGPRIHATPHDKGVHLRFTPGLNPGVNSGLNPGPYPGLNPGLNPGFSPRLNSVFNPRFNPGFNPSFIPGIIDGLPASDSSWPRIIPGNRPSGPDRANMISNTLSPNTSSARSRSYDSADLTLIATDLNNLVSDMIVEVNSDLKTSSDATLKAPQMQKVNPEPEGLHNKKAKPSNHIPRNIGIGMFHVTQKERIYLQEFYLGFASVILPFNAYDPVQQSYYNPMRDILFYSAFNESFMLAAILAQGARSVFMQSESPDDEFAYYMYLLQCLELLGPALGGHMSKAQVALLPDIEAVLLTVLLLTSSNAANLKQNWRPHLRGAKDILLKHTTSRKGPSNSKLLLLCKYWFVSFEILAGLGLKFGGTVEVEDELDLLLGCLDRNEIQVLRNLGMLCPSGFYLIGGYHIDLIPAWKDLIKLLNRKRRNINYKLDETLEYLRLLAIFERLNGIEFVNRKALLKNSDFLGGFVPAGLLLDLISTSQDHIIISWMDISHQLYCIAATITILTEFIELRYDSPQIQSLVSRLMSLLEFLSEFKETPPTIKCAVMMIQWPVVVAGINLVRNKDKNLVFKFFDLAMKAGAGSAGYSISRIKKIWKSREEGFTGSIDDEIDIVPY
ncbi:hypothetical protein METBIDRAFT_30769 [Metschnikowia bicuspidata var. bicuspidata NRRL YB-4993]|uniref:Zn(2)-C6 fungal-type domain-containing protein n=1 Tax=Metschnikowia bicuspidata var. bicuspidata NRRL YB-4993 TaxID=869754 RepID=A0A1A0HKH2_9ASCO|nr:hypothetical protein METBIDRAFT_30769 [Metschnikowia bicuspidata var. bicuspidata NRRL YB-4993]OBA24525.1 hypothetical protein METBIDRAFT_30769 [Metschnikowia bicuspidata var. bicuspidata NRRL YB-4993]